MASFYGIYYRVFRLFDRYIIKEIIPPFFVGLLVYTFVLLMNQILLFSEVFITKGVSLEIVLSLLFYLIPSVFAFTIPMSVLMGILAGLSRMSSDAEVTAFKTLGVSSSRFLRPILVFSLVGLMLTSFLTLYLAPRANFQWIKTFSNSVVAKAHFRIRAREFNESIPNTVIFIQDIMHDESWKNIFVYFSDTPEEPRTIFAKRGRLNFYAAEKRAALELFDGVIHSYPLSDPERYRVTSFKHLEEEVPLEDFFSSISAKKRVREKDIGELNRDVKIIKKELEKIPESGKTSIEFLQKQREYISHRVEIHKKIALPFACLIFAFLGLSLGASTKKGGRTSGFTISIVIIIIYYILITAGEQLAMDGKISPLLGMWGPNILLSLSGLYFFIKSIKESSLFSFYSRFFKREKKVITGVRKTKFQRKRRRFSLRFPNILDRYIIRRYAVIFSLIFISILVIFFVVTFFERIDSIYEHNKAIALLFKFIWFKTPEFVHYTLPVAALASTLLCLGILTKCNEATAMKACGISLYRMVLPVLFLAGLVSFLSFYMQENLLPYSNKKAEEILNKINDRPPRSYNYINRQWVMNKKNNRIYHYLYFDPIGSSFSQLTIYDINASSWSMKSRFFSERAYLERGRLWLSKCWYREFKADRPIRYEKKKEIELTHIEDRNYFLKEWREPDQMNYRELKRYIDEIEEKDFETVRFKVDLNYKTSFPLAALIMTIIGIPFAFSMGKRGTLFGIGLSIVIAIVYWGSIGIFKSLGYVSYLNAFLAAWGPNLIFGLGGLYLLLTLRT